MTQRNDQIDPSDEPELPATLEAELRRLYGAAGEVPTRVDEAILAAARAHFARQKQFRRLLRWVGAGAAAAIILLGVRVAVVEHRTPSLAHLDTSPTHQIDILDAFTLARHLKAGDKLDQSWDVNHDGATDDKDVEALAAQAVKLTRGDMQ